MDFSAFSIFHILFISLLVPYLASSSAVRDPESVVDEVHKSINASRRNLGYLSCGSGNPIDDCWRCDPNWERNRQKLADCGIGFGKNALGGKNDRFYVVTDAGDDDPVNPKPDDRRTRRERSYIGRAMHYHTLLSNIIVHGINIHDCKPGGSSTIRDSPEHAGHWDQSDGDGVSIFNSKNIWVDHCTLSNCQDGLIDVIHGSTAVTISNNYMTHHDKVMLLGHNDEYTQDKDMQVTVAFNHFGEGLVQRMPRCRHGYFHVVNNDYTHWEMYAIGGSANPTINSQGNRFLAPDDSSKKEVTKHEDAPESEWRSWNWRSEGDLMMNGAFFRQTGVGASSTYARASSLSARPSSLVGPMTATAGALNCRIGSHC
ncbi:hypothetical protein V6N13_044281 [Hibiscus sabdariffa]|uniref:Pectate lyase n=1 Tax=Hibiscus sabdariffa TaxID=183260 RepID=A0ABR2RHQ3_9ROSI